MKLANQIFSRQILKEYYFLYGNQIAKHIKEIPKREFAYAFVDRPGLKRHLSLENSERLCDMLKTVSPLHFYHSGAYYLFPDKEMDAKNWIEADLIFDIDVDHFENKELPNQDFIEYCKLCHNCFPPSTDICIKCNNKLKSKLWLNQKDLLEAKNEAVRLINVLNQSFGVHETNMMLYFSGSRGFHVILDKNEFKNLDQSSRMDIVDYMRLTGYNLSYSEPIDLKNILKQFIQDDYKIFDKKERKMLEAIKKKMLSKDEAESLTLIQKFSPKNRSIFEKYIKKKKMIEIDAPVTSDIHRLIRAPYSVHGKSGLSKIPVQDVDLFNPFLDPVLLSRRKITAKISYMPKTIFIDNEYGPYFNEVQELPECFAMFLIGRGVAYIV